MCSIDNNYETSINDSNFIIQHLAYIRMIHIIDGNTNSAIVSNERTVKQKTTHMFHNHEIKRLSKKQTNGGGAL